MRLPSLVVPFLGAAILLTLMPSAAHADSVADAKDLFSRGRDLRGHGDCASAIPLFRKAYELYPGGLGSLRNTAECEESVGHFASSRRAWLDLKRALLTVDDRKYDGWARDADDAAARLAPKLATLTLDVTAVGPGGVTASAEGVEVRLNGEVLAPDLLGTQLARDPGRYVVRVAGPRVGAPQERVIELGAGESERVALRVVVLPPGQASPPEPSPTLEPSAAPAPPSELARAPQPAEDVHPDSTRRTLTWVAFGVGAAGVVGTVASAIVRQPAVDAVTGNTGCHDTNGWTCDARLKSALQPDINTGTTASTLVNVFVTVAVVGIVTGVVLLATRHPRSAGAALVLSPTGAWTMGTF